MSRNRDIDSGQVKSIFEMMEDAMKPSNELPRNLCIKDCDEKQAEIEMIDNAEKQVVDKKPLKRMTFYLDLKAFRGVKNLTNEIKALGGAVETFLCKDIKYVVTNCPDWKRQIIDSSADSYSPSTPNSLSLTKSLLQNDSPCTLESSTDKVASRSVKSRGSALLEKAKQSNMARSNNVVQIAHRLGIKIVPLLTFTRWIKKLKCQNNGGVPSCNIKSSSTCSNIQLVSPYIKYEDINRRYRPQYYQFQEWPVLNITAVHTRSPFYKMERVDHSCRIPKRSPSKDKPVNMAVGLKEPKAQFAQVASRDNLKAVKEQGKKPGYCETCRGHFDDAFDHIKTKSHQKYEKANGFYSKLDQRIALLPDITELSKFLSQKLNLNGVELLNKYRHSFNDMPVNSGNKQKENVGVNESHIKDSMSTEFSSPRRKKRKTAPSYVVSSKTQPFDGENRLNVSATRLPAFDFQQVNYEGKDPWKIKDVIDTRKTLGVTEYPKPYLMGGINTEILSKQTSFPTCRRPALEPKDLNIVDCSKLVVDHDGGSVICDSSINSPIQRSDSVKVLRSTSQRRRSSQSHSSSSSSPTVVTPSNGIDADHKFVKCCSPVSRHTKGKINRQNWPRRLLGKHLNPSSISHSSDKQDLKNRQPFRRLLQQTFNEESPVCINQSHTDTRMHTPRKVNESKIHQHLNVTEDDASLSSDVPNSKESNVFINTEGNIPAYTCFVLPETTTKTHTIQLMDELKLPSTQIAFKDSKNHLEVGALTKNTIETKTVVERMENELDNFGHNASKRNSSSENLGKYDNSSKLILERNYDSRSNDATYHKKTSQSSEIYSCVSGSFDGESLNLAYQTPHSLTKDQSPSLPKYILRKVHGLSDSWAVHIVGES